MIGKVSGMLDHKGADHALIDTGGVGYIVYCSDRTLAQLPAEGGRVARYTDMVVREDLLQLFGFVTVAEREWHRLLTSDQGEGAKAALAIQGTLGPAGARAAMATAPGPVADVVESAIGAPVATAGNGAAQADALSALLNLGYGQGEAAAAVAEAAGEEADADASALIKSALRRLAPKG